LPPTRGLSMTGREGQKKQLKHASGSPAADIQVSIQGNVSGQVAVGSNILQIGSIQGGIVNILPPEAAVAPRPRPKPVLLRPRPFRGLLDRTIETGSALAAFKAALPLELYGSAGSGKTALIRHIAHVPETNLFPDGVVYLSARQQTASELLQSLFDAVYESDIPFKATDAQLRHALNACRALVIFDDTSLDREAGEAVMDVAPNCAFFLASTERRLWGEVRGLALSGLPQEDALVLLERELGRVLPPQERAAAQGLADALEGHPLRLLQAAALVREGRESLEGLRDQLRSRAFDDVAVAAAASRPERERNVLALLALMGGASVHARHLAALAGVPDVESVLEHLAGAGLAQGHGSRYGVPEALREPLQVALDAYSWTKPALEYFAAWAAQNGWQSILGEAEALLQIMHWGAQQQHWKEVLNLARPLEASLALSLKWDAWSQTLRWSLDASQSLNDPAAQAWALHQTGTRHLCLGERASGRWCLQQAVRLRESLGDRLGAQVSRHNLNLLETPPPASDVPDTSPAARPQSSPVSKLFKVLLPALVVLLGGWYGLKALLPPARPEIPASGLSTQQLNYGQHSVGETAPPQQVTLTNVGAGLLRVADIRIDGAQASDFRVMRNDCSDRQIAAREQCGVSISFAPQGQGEREARLWFRDNSAQSPQFVALKGVAVVADLPRPHANPDSLAYAEREVGAGSESQTVTLRNIGTGTLEILGLQLAGDHAGDFSVAADGCSLTKLPASRDCTVEVRYSPSVPGSRNAELVVAHGGAGSPLKVPLHARASAPLPRLSSRPSEIDFGHQEIGSQGRPRQVAVSNLGLGSVSISVLRLDGGPAAGFSVVEESCLGSTLSKGADCRVTLMFSPRSPGERSSMLIAGTSDTPRLLAIALTGTGLAAPTIEFNVMPQSVNFGEVTLGNSRIENVALLNKGSATVWIQVMKSDASDFVLAADECSNRAVDPRQSCSFQVRFTPRTSGAQRAAVSIPSNSSQGVQSLPLSGQGMPVPVPMASVSPSSLDFGSLASGESRIALVSVTSTGQAPLKIDGATISAVTGAGFSIANDACAKGLLSSGLECSITVRFIPSFAGLQTARLVVRTNAADASLAVPMRGIGTFAALSYSPASLDFGKQAVGNNIEQRITVLNTGTAPARLGSHSVVGSSSFVITSSNCPELLGAGSNCVMQVRFLPGAAGVHSARLSVDHNARNGSQNPLLSGIGVDQPRGHCCQGGKISSGWIQRDCEQKAGVFSFEARGLDSVCRQPELNGYCCQGGKISDGWAQQACLQQQGTFSLDRRELEGRCSERGYCCEGGKVSSGWTPKDCARRKGLFSFDLRDLELRCRPPELHGYCCQSGKISDGWTYQDCTQKQGIFSMSRKELELRCAPPDPVGYCCQNGKISRWTQRDCEQRNGLFSYDPRELERKCAPPGPAPGYCCLGGKVSPGWTAQDCERRNGRFSYDANELEQKCLPRGYCCQDGRISADWTPEECARRKGVFSFNANELQERCVPQGYCCLDGKISANWTPQSCAQRKGAFSFSLNELKGKCSDPSGYCCDDGKILANLTFGQCRQKGGQFSLNRKDLDRTCGRHELRDQDSGEFGYCCDGGNMTRTRRLKCRGYFSLSEQEVRKRCSKSPVRTLGQRPPVPLSQQPPKGVK